MRKIIFLAIFLFSTTPSHAILKNPRWQNAGWNASGQFVMFAPDVEVQNKIFLLSDVTGQWYSNDKGENWIWMNGGDAYLSEKGTALVQDPNNPHILWQLGNYMLKSEDRGQTWIGVDDADALRPHVHRAIAIDPNDSDNVLYANNDGSIRRTTDGGDSWSTYATPFSNYISLLTFSPDGTRLMVSEQNEGLGYYDIDDTDTFHDISPTGTNAEYVLDYCKYTKDSVDYICVTAGNKVACSSDQGDTWNYTAATGIASDRYMWRLACTVDNSNNVRFIASARTISTKYTGNIVISDDGGQTWSIDVPQGMSNTTPDFVGNPTRVWVDYINPMLDFAYDPFDPDTVYMLDDWGVWRSDDHGGTWVEKDEGAQMAVVTDLALSPNNRLFATAMDSGLFYSDDWGDTWTQTFPDGTTYDIDEAGHIWQVVTTGDEADWIAGNGRVIATSTMWSDFKPRVIYSEDNGETWTVTNSGLPNAKQNNGNWQTGYNRSLTVDPQNEDILYMGLDGWNGSNDQSSDDGGIFQSVDGGETWSRLNVPESHQLYNCIQVDPNNQANIFLGTFADYAYYSTNTGSSYTQTTGISYVYDCLANASSQVFVAGNSSGPYLSRANSFSGSLTNILDPAGETTGAFDGLAANPDDPNQLIVGVFGKPLIYFTGNATSTPPIWKNYTYDNPSIDGTHDFLFAPDCGNEGCIFAAGNGSGIFKLDLEITEGIGVEGINFSGINLN